MGPEVMSSPKLKAKLIYLGIIVIVFIFCSNLFFYKSTTSAIVTLNSVKDNSLNVLLGDSITTVDIKVPEIVSGLLIEGDQYFIGYDTYPVWGSKLTKIEPLP